MSLKSLLPNNTQEAYLHGRKCHENGKSIEYNPYRNLDNNTSHLWSAWNRGWKSAIEPKPHNSAMTNE